MIKTFIATAAASALMAGAAFAQEPSTTSTQAMPQQPASTSTMPSTGTSVTTDSSVTTETPAMPAAATTTTTSATDYASGASVTTSMTTNGPVPDTAENRAKYGAPMSRAGKRTAASGN